MLKIKKQRMRFVEHEYFLFYGYKNEPTSGFMFRCNELGQLKGDLQPEAQESLQLCRENKVGEFLAPIVKDVPNRYITPAIGECVCGKDITLEADANRCGCGRFYNLSGQELEPNTLQWGEETGERFDSNGSQVR